METRNVVALTIIVLLTIGVLALGFRASRNWWGSRTFRKALLPQLVINAVINLIFVALFVGVYSQIGFNASSLLILLNIISVLGLGWLAIQRSRLNAPVLLDVGTPSKEALQAMSIFLAFGVACYGFVLLVSTHPSPLEYILLVTWALLSGLGLYWMSKQRTQILSTGICYGDQFIGWNRLESYEWEEPQRANVHTLSLRLKSRFSLFSIKPVRIPSQYQLAVDDYLGKYVAQQS